MQPELRHWFGLSIVECTVMPMADLNEFLDRLSTLPPIGGHLGEYEAK